jgi:hypothetical protein
LQKVVQNWIYNGYNSESAVTNENSTRNTVVAKEHVLHPEVESSTKNCLCYVLVTKIMYSYGINYVK